jgi:superfamily II DNA or RNA helicase
MQAPPGKETMLWGKGYSIRRKSLSDGELSQIRKALTYQPRGHPDYPQPAKFFGFTESTSWVRVPRHYGITHHGNPTLNLLKDVPRRFQEPVIGLREYQKNVVENVVGHLERHGTGMLSLYTSWGKTFGALHIAAAIGQRTIIFVHKSQLLKQWVEEINKVLPAAKVGLIQGSKKDVSDDVDIVVAMIQTVVNMASVPPMFGFSIVDECLPGEQHILTSAGPLRIKDAWKSFAGGREVQVHCLTKGTRSVTTRRIKNAWRTQVPRPLVSVVVVCVLGGAEHRTTVSCTIDHRWATPVGWVRAMHLFRGHPVITQGLLGQCALAWVESVSQRPGRAVVYDIEVEDHHNFIACGRRSTPSDPVLSNCHHIAAETFSTIFEKCTTRYAMGISATVQRKDGLTKVLHHHLGQLVVDIQADVNEREATIHVLEYPKAAVGRTPVDRITCIVRDEERNRLILGALKKLIEEDVRNERKILILSERRDHVKRIGDELGEMQHAKSVGIYLGGMKTTTLDAEKNKDVVCSTYTMFGEGISVKELNTLVLLTPKGDVCQVMGRIFRQRHMIRPWIVDIVDAGGEGKLRSRMKTYRAQLSDMVVTRQGLRADMKWSHNAPSESILHA